MISEKVTLDKFLTSKATDMRDGILNEVQKMENDMNRALQ